MGSVLRLVETETDGPAGGVDLMEIGRPRNLGDIASLGLTLPEAKPLLPSVQRALMAAQARDHAVLRPSCSSSGDGCHINDARLHQVATLFGAAARRLPRFRCAGCGHGETWINCPPHCLSTSELHQRQVHLPALLPYRAAAGVLAHLLPVQPGMNPETLRGDTLKIGERLRDAAASKPAVAAPAITIAVDATFHRSCGDGERHLEVRVGNVEPSEGSRHVFGAVAKADTDLAVLIRGSLGTVGRTANTALTAFIDGCPRLQSVLAAAGVTEPPIARWLHIAMRFPHAKQAASCLSTDEPGRMQAKTAIVAEAERLHRRIWNRRARSAQLTLQRIRKVVHVFKGEHGRRQRGLPSRKLWHVLHAVDGHLRGQTARLVNHGRRYFAVLCVRTSVTDGTATFLADRRMNKSQQVRRSRRGADLLPQLRCALYNGALGTGFGHLFEPAFPSKPRLAKAACPPVSGQSRSLFRRF